MPDSSLRKELWAAIAKGDCVRVQELAAAGADLNEPLASSAGETPLIRSVTAGNTVLLKLLISLGADVNLPGACPKSWTPLMYAREPRDDARVGSRRGQG